MKNIKKVQRLAQQAWTIEKYGDQPQNWWVLEKNKERRLKKEVGNSINGLTVQFKEIRTAALVAKKQIKEDACKGEVEDKK